MDIYVLKKDCGYDPGSILGVYSTREKAEKAAQAYYEDGMKTKSFSGGIIDLEWRHSDHGYWFASVRYQQLPFDGFGIYNHSLDDSPPAYSDWNYPPLV